MTDDGTPGTPPAEGDEITAAGGEAPARQVFVSHAVEDAAAGTAICAMLRDAGFTTWMAPDDILGGRPWAEQIVEAIHECPVFLLVLSPASNESDGVLREVDIAAEQRKAIVPVRVTDVRPSGGLNYLLRQAQWEDAFPPPVEDHREQVVGAVAAIILGAGDTVETQVPWQPEPAVPEVPWYRRPAAIVAAVAAGIVVLGVALFALLAGGDETTMPDLVGLREPAAVAALDNAGLDGSAAQYVAGCFSAGVSPGTVASQDPVAGEAVSDASDVVVELQGGDCVLVPDVVGVDQGGAERTLRNAGLAASVGTECGGDVGSVASQQPDGDVSVVFGTEIVLGVADEGCAANWGALMPGGLLFHANRDGDYDLYIRDQGGGDPVQFADHPADDLDPSMSPDGSRIVFSSDRNGSDSDLFVLDLSELSIIRLTSGPEWDVEPAWSPDGSEVVFVRRDTESDDDESSRLFMATVTGDEPDVRPLATGTPGSAVEPSWSPDGGRIAFTRIVDGKSDIFMIGVDGSGLEPVATSRFADRYPAWSPDGSEIAHLGPGPDLFVRAVGSDPGVDGEQLSDDDFAEREPAWTEDGGRIAYRRGASGSSPHDIWIIDVASKQAEALVAGFGDTGSPSWIPDGG